MTSPRLRRLNSDAEKVSARFAEWPTIQVVKTSGSPPEQYQIAYRVKGLFATPDGRIQERDEHIMEVNLTLGYPRRAPQCRMLTPIFHPNFDDASVCIGDFWAPSEGLDDLFIRIGRMIAYQEYNIKSPLNGLAARWAEEHGQQLPVDGSEVAPPMVSQQTQPPAGDKIVVNVGPVADAGPAPSAPAPQPEPPKAPPPKAEPAAPSLADAIRIKVVCPGCGARINATSEMAGKTGRCPKCKTPVTVPN